MMIYLTNTYLLLFFATLIGLKETIALDGVELQIPDSVTAGDNVTLVCQYDLESDVLYNIKWYLGQTEFLRYSPGDNPSTQVFPIPNRIRKVTFKWPRSLVLHNVSTESSGRYTCEVAGDAPTFVTGRHSKQLHVKPKAKAKEDSLIVFKLNEKGGIVCSYNEAKQVESITWLKDGKEFYKYESGVEQTFAINQIPVLNAVIKQKISSTELAINNITHEIAGRYICEVTAKNQTKPIKQIRDVQVKDTNKGNHVTVTIPQLVKVGEDVIIKCQINVFGEKVSRVRWFKGNREFYISGLHRQEPTTIIPIEGVNAKDLTPDHMPRFVTSQILLKKVTPDTAGTYRCEAGGWDKGYVDSAVLSVIQIPTGDPALYVDNDFLREGDTLHAECASSPSIPPAEITWLLNGQEVEGHVSTKKSEINIGLPTPVSSSLSLKLKYGSFYSGKASLSCVVTVGDDYRKEKKVTLEKDISEHGSEWGGTIHYAMSGKGRIPDIPTGLLLFGSLLLFFW